MLSTNQSQSDHAQDRNSDHSFDSLMPPQMAARAEQLGSAKCQQPKVKLFALSLLAGAFISLGAVFSISIFQGPIGNFPIGLMKLASGSAFSLGLILVVVGGAELFTGNNLIVMAWANRKLTFGQVLENWLFVYLGNFVGAIGTAILLFFSEQYLFAGGTVGLYILELAERKLSFNFASATFLGILCNVLVCLAVWLSYSARTTTDKILSITIPVTAFVTLGFEHSIANMFYLPLAWLIKSFGSDYFWQTVQRSASEFNSISWSSIWFDNLLPVTLGNLIGGAGLVGIVYWFVYLRQAKSKP